MITSNLFLLPKAIRALCEKLTTLFDNGIKQTILNGILKYYLGLEISF